MEGVGVITNLNKATVSKSNTCVFTPKAFVVAKLLIVFYQFVLFFQKNHKRTGLCAAGHIKANEITEGTGSDNTISINKTDFRNRMFIC